MNSSSKQSLRTKIEKLDWNLVHSDTQYLTHAIHRYSGKFIPQIARQAMMLLTCPGDLILDPFCGSGTTLLEAALCGRRSVGIDMNPLAVLITKVKTTSIDGPLLKRFVQRLISQLTAISQFNSGQPNLLSGGGHEQEMLEMVRNDWRWQDEWYRKWYQDSALADLTLIRLLINGEQSLPLRNLAYVAFSDILRKTSNANTSYPNVMFDKNRGAPPSPIKLFAKRLNEIASAVEELHFPLLDLPHPLVIRGDNRSLMIATESVDAVITHPPYVGSIPYAEYGVLSLTWLGFNAKALDRALTGGRRQARDVVTSFESAYSAMVRESYRVLKSGGYMLLLVGDPTVKGVRVDLTEMSNSFAVRMGFELVAQTSRSGLNRRANLMGNETLLVYQKS